MTKIVKPERSYGKHTNEYSKRDIGDTLNELIDVLAEKEVIQVVKKEKPKQKKVKPKKEFKFKKNKEGGFTIRSKSSGNKVYYVLDEQKRWIKNPETLKKLGFGFNNVKFVDEEEFKSYETGEPIDLTEGKESEGKESEEEKDEKEPSKKKN